MRQSYCLFKHIPSLLLLLLLWCVFVYFFGLFLKLTLGEFGRQTGSQELMKRGVCIRILYPDNQALEEE